MILAALLFVSAADGPAAALEADVRRAAAGVERSVVALVVSHSNAYPKLEEVAGEQKPGTLGGYNKRDRGANPFLGPERDLLDLSDHRNVPDNHFGTGLVIDPAGLILTNYHVIEGATRVFVRLPGGGGSYADIHAADGRSDLAVLRLRSMPREANLRAVKFADVQLTGPNAVKIGSFVVAVAHPFAAGAADGKPSIGFGLISNTRRRILGLRPDEQRNQHVYQFAAMIQTDARLNLGCSGGALVNLDGEVVGLTTAAAGVAGSDSAGGFAIPMTANFRRIVDRLRLGREVEYGFLGVTPDLPALDRPGLTIRGVTGRGPAEAAGLHAGCVIESVNGETVRDQEDLFLHVGAAQAGTAVAVRYYPNSSDQLTVARRVLLAKFLNTFPVIASEQPDAIHGLRVEYASIRLQENIKPGFTGLEHEGVVVRNLLPGSAAEAKFKALGGNASDWVITKVNNAAVLTPDEFYAACRRSGAAVELTVAKATDRSDRGREITLP